MGRRDLGGQIDQLVGLVNNARFHIAGLHGGQLGEVAGDAVSIDRAIKAGFNWELGPFEMWDAAGVRETVTRMLGKFKRDKLIQMRGATIVLLAPDKLEVMAA